MVQRVSTVSFAGIEVRPVDVQVQVAPGMPAFTLVDRQWQIGSRLAGILEGMSGPSSFKKPLKPWSLLL
jgi:hypothetical protein